MNVNELQKNHYFSGAISLVSWRAGSVSDRRRRPEKAVDSRNFSPFLRGLLSPAADTLRLAKRAEENHNSMDSGKNGILPACNGLPQASNLFGKGRE
jgi:hypothetical protein